MPVFKFKNRDCIAASKSIISQAIQKYSDGKGGELVVRRPDKTREQEKRYHAIIGDIARHGKIEYMGVMIDFNGYDLPPPQVSKLLLVSWFEDDLRSSGFSLKNPGQWILDPVTKMPIRERAQTRLFTKEEGGWFTEFLMTIVAENRISLSDESLSAYEEYKEAQ